MKKLFRFQKLLNALRRYWSIRRPHDFILLIAVRAGHGSRYFLACAFAHNLKWFPALRAANCLFHHPTPEELIFGRLHWQFGLDNSTDSKREIGFVPTTFMSGMSLDCVILAPSKLVLRVSPRYIRQPPRSASRKLAPMALLNDSSAFRKLALQNEVRTRRAPNKFMPSQLAPSSERSQRSAWLQFRPRRSFPDKS